MAHRSRPSHGVHSFSDQSSLVKVLKSTTFMTYGPVVELLRHGLGYDNLFGIYSAIIERHRQTSISISLGERVQEQLEDNRPSELSIPSSQAKSTSTRT